MVSYDVIVVGGGGSGLAAAASAAENGLKVLLLERQPVLGGATGIAVGSYTSNRTKWQKMSGVEDTLDDHAVDAGKFAPEPIESRNNEQLRRFFLSHSADTLNWLADMGLTFHGPSPEPPNRRPRMHNVVPGAKAYILALQKKLLHHGGTILTEADVTNLTLENGRVTGVRARVPGDVKDFGAKKAVILAAGDYANGGDLIRQYKGPEYGDIEGIYEHARGDGHRLALQAKAKLVNMDITYGPELRFIAPPQNGKSLVDRIPAGGALNKLAGKMMPLVPKAIMNQVIKRQLVTWQHPEAALFDDGAILVNQKGKRFCDEKESPWREVAVARQAGKIAYILLDANLIEKYSEWPHFISTAPEIAYAYVEDYLKLRPDVAVAANNLETLARERGMDGAQLQMTVEEHNKKNTPKLYGDRWVLLGPCKAYFTTTEGGAAITEQMQVLDEDGKPVPGLYAVGQNGLGGQVLWGHGLHIAWAITSGRLVGRYLAGKG